jgi:hypothetical protein
MARRAARIASGRVGQAWISRYTTRMNPIGETQFIDGITRPVYLDADGRQFVLDDDSNRVYGFRINIDEPIIVEAPRDPGSVKS